MPIYEFHCQEHGRFEKFEKKYTKTAICPECQKRCEKVFSSVNANFSPWAESLKKEIDWATRP